MPGSANSPVLAALSAAFGVDVQSIYALTDRVRNAAQHAVQDGPGTHTFIVDSQRFLSCRCDQRRMIIVFGPYRRETDEPCNAPALTEALEAKASEALALSTQAYCDLDDVRHERLEFASQLELVGSAVIAITGQLGIETVLRRIVDLARELAGARYAALGVPNSQGELESFIVSGVTPEQELAIGPRPRGRGMLGLLLREPRIIRLADLKDHPDSVGFPPNHPPMKSFLGVPIITHGHVLGNLYLTEKRTGTEFSDEDARLVEILARHAAVAIENAQLYRQMELDRRRLNLLIDQFPEAVIVVEPDPEQVTMVNQQTSRLLGWDIETPMPMMEFLGRNRRLDLQGNPIPDLEVPMVRALRGGEVLARSEVMIERPNGERITILVNGAPLMDDRGTVIAAIAVFQDYTQIRDAEQIKDDFLSLVSHELRTPLTTIRGGAFMLRHDRESLDDIAQDALLADVEREGERLQFIIENMVQLANIRAGRYSLETEPLHMRLLIERAIRIAHETAPERHFEPTIEPNLFAEADKTSVDQILLNLLRNAIKYTPSNSKIEVDARRDGEMIEISVRDHGPGISDEDLPYVFERFRRGAESQRSRIEGMGVGLYLAKNLVEAHGGSIVAERPSDGGTRIRFTIPALLEDED
ncbi:MAG: ATP-binding protein [Nitrolancea sp.]